MNFPTRDGPTQDGSWRKAILATMQGQDAVLAVGQCDAPSPAQEMPDGIRVVALNQERLGLAATVADHDLETVSHEQVVAGQGDLVAALTGAGVRRLLVVPGDAAKPEDWPELAAAEIEVVPVYTTYTSGAEDYMAEEDAEDVAERLRQLGYL